MRLAIRDLFATRSVGIWLFDDHQKTVAKPIMLEMEPIKEGYQLPEPTLTIESLHLMNLLSSGATELEISTLGRSLMPNRDKELSALKYHLEDMRKLVFKEKRKAP